MFALNNSKLAVLETEPAVLYDENEDRRFERMKLFKESIKQSNHSCTLAFFHVPIPLTLVLNIAACCLTPVGDFVGLIEV